jgi:transcriptional regulator with XRE-family HTH domain
MDEKEYLLLLGEKLTALRKAKNMTQEELAGLIGTKHTQIRRMEKGTVNSTINMLRRVAGVLGIDISELVKIEHTK